MANGWERLGEVFAGTAAGGNDSYSRGVSKQAQLAQLLAGAQIKQDEAMARDELLGSMIANGTARPEATMLSTMLRMGADPTKISGYHGDVQTQGFQSEAMDAARSGNVPLLNDIMTAISGKPRQTATMSEGTLFDPYGAVGQTVNVTPVGQSTIGQRNAAAAASYASADNSRASASRTRQGQQLDLMKAQQPGAPGGMGGGAPSKPLPAAALKMQQEELSAIGVADAVDRALQNAETQIKDGKLVLGLGANQISSAMNYFNHSTEKTRNYQSFRSNLEKLRNDSLRLNKGVQTEGDAERAWNELFNNLNDQKYVQQRLGEIREINRRGAELRRYNIDVIRNNFGAGSLDIPTSVGAPATPPPAGALGNAFGNASGVDDLLGKYGIR